MRDPVSSSAARVLVAIAIAATGALTTACGEKAPLPTFRVTFHAEADPGEPLAGADVSVGPRRFGATDPDGSLVLDLVGREGSRHEVNVRCPAGYRSPTDLPDLVLRSFRTLDPEAARRGIAYSISCPPEKRLAAILVRARGQAALPVVMGAREIARTDGAGVAHVLLRLDPNTTFRVGFDTTSVPDLRPQSPAATFTVADADEIFVLDQPFEQLPTKRPPRRRGPRPPPVHIPIRIQ